MERTEDNERTRWIRPATVCAATIAVVYGIVGVVLGIHGVAMPCNRYADAIVTGCGPGQSFGDFRFNITYVDDVGKQHDGEIASAATGCSAGVVGQSLRICYPLKDRDAFQNGTVMFSNPVVTPALLGSAIPSLVGGASVLCFLCGRSDRGDFKLRRHGVLGMGQQNEFIIPMGFVYSSSSSSNTNAPCASSWTSVGHAHAHH